MLWYGGVVIRVVCGIYRNCHGLSMLVEFHLHSIYISDIQDCGHAFGQLGGKQHFDISPVLISPEYISVIKRLRCFYIVVVNGIR